MTAGILPMSGRPVRHDAICPDHPRMASATAPQDAPTTEESASPEAISTGHDAAANLAGQDALLDKILSDIPNDDGEAGAEESEPAEPSAEAEAGADGDEPTTDEDAKPEDQKPEQDAKPTAAELSEEQIRRGVDALLKDRVPQHIITELMTKDPETFVSWAKDAASRQAEVARRLQAQAEARRQTETADDGQDGQAKPGGAEGGKPQPMPEAAAIGAELVETLGDDTAEPVAKFAGRILAEVDRRVKAHLGAIDQVRPLVEGLAIQQCRQQLATTFPDLQKPERFTAVVKRMKDMGASGQYTDYGTLMEAACVAEFAPTMLEQIRRGVVAGHAQRAKGSVTLTDRSGSQGRPKPLSEEDIALMAIQGKTREQIAAEKKRRSK